MSLTFRGWFILYGQFGAKSLLSHSRTGDFQIDSASNHCQSTPKYTRPHNLWKKMLVNYRQKPGKKRLGQWIEDFTTFSKEQQFSEVWTASRISDSTRKVVKISCKSWRLRFTCGRGDSRRNQCWGCPIEFERSTKSCEPKKTNIPKLGGGFKYFLFSPLLGEDFHFD